MKALTCVLLCLFVIGCGSKTSQIEQESILDAISVAEELVGDEFEITAVPSSRGEESGFHIAVADGKLSCELVNADLRKTLLRIADAAQLQFVFSGNIYGRVNAKFSDLDLEEGINLILDSAHYVLEKKGEIWSVRRAPDAPTGVEYHEVMLQHVSAEELMKRVAAFYSLPFVATEDDLADLGYDESDYDDTEEVVEMKPFAGPASLRMKDVTIIKAINRNVLLVSGENSQVDEMLDLIAALDQEVPQVLIETYLVEYDEEALRESGIDLSAELINGLSSLAFNVPRGSTADFIVLPAITSILSLPAIADGKYERTWGGEASDGDPSEGGEDDFFDEGGDEFGSGGIDTNIASIAAKIHALMDENKLTIISKPYIIVSNGAQAYISAASQQYVIAALPDQPLATGSLEQVQTRISFRILPTIISNNRVHIQLSLEQSEFTTPRANAVLSTNKNTARTNLIVDDGETIVVGGVNSSREATVSRGVPVLRSIPILKYIFGASRKVSSKRKVNFYVTPHILPLAEGIVREMINE
ncbi:hypothetical protein ACFL6S_01300 [Candidatus Poribacteria bacterium]